MEPLRTTKVIMPTQDGWIGHPLSSSIDFDTYAQSWGGVARGREFQPLDLRLQQEYVFSRLIWENIEKSRSSNALGQPFSTHFGFVECDDPDAFVQYIDGVHYCGLHTGLVRTSFYLADEIVLIRDMIPGLGRRFEYEERDDLDLCPDAEKLKERNELAVAALIGASRSRISTRDHFAHLMVTFCIFHEFNHAISGHSAFLSQRRQISRLHEHGSLKVDGLSSDLHREVEYTADIGAAESMFDYAHRGTVFRRLSKRPLRSPVLHRLFITVLAVICAQWNRMNQEHGEDGLHPEPAARFAACLLMYTLLLQEHYPFWRWALIGKRAIKDVARIAGQCEYIAMLLSQLSAYDQDSSYWSERAPSNNLVRHDDVKDLFYPYKVQPKPYRSRRLQEMIRSSESQVP